MSDRYATFVLNGVAQSLRHDVGEINISRSSIYRERKKCRVDSANATRDGFNPAVSLTVHWDGKLIPALTGKEKVDRLPVLVSGFGVDQLLSVPKLASGSGENQADAIVKALEDWEITDRVEAMSFDTTASNTGPCIGACTLVQQKLEKKLLSLACRHHILEIVVGAVFTKCLKLPPSGPNVQLFNRFSNKLFSCSKFTTVNL